MRGPGRVWYIPHVGNTLQEAPMRDRVLLCASVVGALGLVLSLPVLAATYEGKVVEVGPGTLTIVDTAGENQQTFEISVWAVIQRAGKYCELTNIKAGDTVTVTTRTLGGETVAITVEANKAEAPAVPSVGQGHGHRGHEERR